MEKIEYRHGFGLANLGDEHGRNSLGATNRISRGTNPHSNSGFSGL
jgi:hypothetical protein